MTFSPRGSSGPVSDRLPDFPWDKLTAYADRARSHPDGIIDLSIGTPVDSTPAVARDALPAASDWPGYPLTVGMPQTRQAVVDWLERRFQITGIAASAVLPLVGSKEFIASLPLHLGVGPGDVVVQPELAYPTYEVGAALAGAQLVRADDLSTASGAVALAWINSPSNPTGRVASIAELRAAVAWARAHNVVLVSDECYLECAWDTTPVSVLDPRVNDGDLTGLLSVHSLSKRSNLAGYRCAFVVGDQVLIDELLAVRKNLGLQMPGPQQEVMAAVLADDAHVDAQHATYAARRGVLRAALESAGFTIDHSEASLYLWATRREPCWDTVAWLAERGVLVAPGDFYGPAGAEHVRVAFTATDERVAALAARLA